MATLLEFLDRFPPHLCRLVARDGRGRRGLSVRELAARAGLSKATITKLSNQRTWRGVRVEVVERFSAACGVDFWRLDGQLKWLRKGKWCHVANAEHEQAKVYRRILEG